MFIRLTYDGIHDYRKGMFEYIEARRIVLIEDRLTISGDMTGSYVYLDGGFNDPIAVKENPAEIIAKINDGDFCMFSNEFISSRGEQGVE